MRSMDVVKKAEVETSVTSRCSWTITKSRNINFTVLISRSQDVTLGHLNKCNIVINKNKSNICDLVLSDQHVPANQAFLIPAVIFRNIERKKICIILYLNASMYIQLKKTKKEMHIYMSILPFLLCIY